MRAHIYLIFLFLSSAMFAQEVTVSGRVVSDDGEELIGATVAEKGTTNGAIVDFNGNYELTVSSEEATILVTYTGYVSAEMKVDNQREIDFMLEGVAVDLSEVEVTGFVGAVGKSRKRTESIQKVPESVTALNQEGIKRSGVTDVGSFANLVPNLKFNTSQAVGVNFISIRGIPQIRGGDAPVAFVIDGVTVPDPSLLNQELYDLALIEVVKGPQGALYGKNAIGGAINIYTQEPTNTFSNKLKVGYGNGNSLLGQFVSSGAIKEDKVYYRFSTQYKKTDGLLTNSFLDEKVDFSTNFNVRGQIIADISSNVKISAAYQHFNLDGGAAYFSVNPVGFEDFGEFFPGGVLAPNPEEGNNTIVANRLGTSDMVNNNGNVKIDVKGKSVTFQSITSINKVDRTTAGDLDFLDFDLLTQGEVTSTTTFNQEFRLNDRNTKDKVNWSVGTFYQNVKKPVYQDGLSPLDFDDPDSPLENFVAADLENNTQTIAIFGFADYKLTEKLTASAGFRFDIDKFEQEDFLSVTSSSRDNNEFQPKFSLAYQATEKALVFANYGRGYRTGGFNPAQTDLFNLDFKDETTDNYELGFKTSSWKDRLIFNGAVFYTKFNNQQQYILDLVDFFAGIYNYEESTVTGFELDTRVRLNKFFDVFASYGFTDAEIIEGGTTGGANGDATDNRQYNGNKTPFVPVSNFGIGLESTFPITEDLQFNGFINLNQTGKTYWHESNKESQTSDAYSLLDARISLGYKRHELALWGRNLLDTQYYQEFSPGEFVGSPDDVAWRGQPISVGTTITIRF